MPTNEQKPAIQFDDMPQQVRAGLLGMWVFLITELMMFGGLFVGFGIMRLQHTTVFADAAGHLNLMLGGINTAVLLTSGLLIVLAEQAVSRRMRRPALWFLLGTILLGVIFLGIKGFEWYLEFRDQLMPVLDLEFNYPGEQGAIAEMFFHFYFILTGLHGFHMLIGLVILAVMAVFIVRWRDPARLERQIRIVGLYWAFVDVVWIFMFTLLYLLRT